MADAENKFNFSFKKEALPHMIGPYQEAAKASSQQEFLSQVPYPFLLFARSTLWDPLLLMARPEKGGGPETAIVSYNINPGGRAFMSPIRKRQSDPGHPDVLLGRDTKNDLVVPVPSISSTHASFSPPDDPGGEWEITDLGTKNGTYIEEQRLSAKVPATLQNGVYLRLGGNMIAWFLLPGPLWEVLNDDAKLKELIEL